METSLKVFEYGEKQVRTVEKDGEAWFVAKDVCDILGLENARQAIKSLDDDEKMTVSNNDGHSGQRGGAQFLNIVNEPGLYKLIFKSRKAEAKQFTRWVTHEVLPDIHKHGMYMSDKLRDAAQVDPEMFEAVMNKYLAEKETRARAVSFNLCHFDTS